MPGQTLCSVCRHPLSEARLKIRPAYERCVVCQTMFERNSSKYTLEFALNVEDLGRSMPAKYIRALENREDVITDEFRDWLDSSLNLTDRSHDDKIDALRDVAKRCLDVIVEKRKGRPAGLESHSER